MSLLDVETGEVSRIKSIPLNRKNESLYEGVLSETDLEAHLFIGARGNISENRIISELPNNIKIAAEQEIFQVLQAGIRGVVIEYLSRPPRDLIEYEQYYLFTIKKEGRFWDKISESMNMRLFVTEDFRSLELILLALLPPKENN
jgi:type VI secretion system protein ImpJ